MGAAIKNRLEHSIYVRSFSGAKVRSMKDYVKPCVRDKNPDHIIMPVGTNDLNTKNNPGRVAKSTVDLVKGMVSEKIKASVSGIIPRNGKWERKKKK